MSWLWIAVFAVLYLVLCLLIWAFFVDSDQDGGDPMTPDQLRAETERPASLDGEAAAARPAFNFRLVLENPDLGWPEDMIEQARALRDKKERNDGIS